MQDGKKQAIKGVDLSIYFTDGNMINIGLSETQIAGIIKLLGLQYDRDNDSITMLSDDGLKKFMDKTINNWQSVAAKPTNLKRCEENDR